MRRLTTILATCLCVTGACRGGAAQEPYDGIVVSGRAAATLAPASPADTDEPMASEVDLRWTIALLSEAEARRVEAARRITLLDSEPVIAEPALDAPAMDIQFALDQHPVAEKPAASKRCSGVVKGRS